MDEIITASATNDYMDADTNLEPQQIQSVSTEYRDTDNQINTNKQPNNSEPTEYRGPNKNNANNPTQTKTTYASAVAEITFPKPEQAIIIEAVDNTPLRDYQIAVGKLIANKNITFASRMSRNRICLYLKTEEIANIFVTNNPYLTLNNNKLIVRKLKSAAKRITFSEVPPHLNNNNLLQQLQKNNLEILSPITLLKSNMRDPEFSHVFSFRRQALVKTDNTELPQSIMIEVDDEIHRIFLSNDDIRCSKCQGKGHIAERCRRQEQEIPKTQTVSPNIQIETRKRQASNSTTSETEQININLTQDANETVEVSVTNSVILGSQPSITIETSKRRRKIQKTTSTPIENLLSPLKTIMEKHQDQYPINYKKLKSFIRETKDVKKTPEELQKLANKYVKEPDQLSEMLFNLYPELKHRSIKARFCVIQNLLSNPEFQPDDTENANTSDTQSEYAETVNLDSTDSENEAETPPQ